jgi:hypothetical protein
MDDIAMMQSSPNKDQALQKTSYYDIDNAFSEVWFEAGNPHAINCATPSEVLHMIHQKGWHEYSLEGFFGILTPAPILFVEALAKFMSEQLQHQCDRDLPRTKFPRGISKSSQLQAHKATGVLLLLVLSLHSHVGWDRHDHHHNHSFVNSSYVNKKNVWDYRTLFEMLLCMEAWYKLKDVPKKQIDSGNAKAAICVAMDKYVATVNRKVGNGIDLVKTHAPLHTPIYISLVGCTVSFDSGPLESSHKDHCKKPSKLTQKRSDLVKEQKCSRHGKESPFLPKRCRYHSIHQE